MKKILAKFIFYRVMGWRIVGRIPTDVPQAIVAVGPHTSSWDFLIGVLSRNVLEQDISFIGKDSLFKGPFGWLFRWLGGYPVDRSRSQGMVEAVVQLFRAHPRFYLSLSPEGTRKKADRLRSGFYHMAVGAGVPIIMVGMDFKHKELRFEAPLYPTGQVEADMRIIQQFFSTVTGKIPAYGVDPPK